jgi:hypothetical protein
VSQPEESREKTGKTDDVLLKGFAKQKQAPGTGGRDAMPDDQEMDRQAEKAQEDQQKMR